MSGSAAQPTIAIASDHAGYELKAHLVSFLTHQGYTVKDFGCENAETSVHYPQMASLVAQEVALENFERGVICCGSGIGVAMAANRYPGVRAAVIHDLFSAEMSRRHNNANVICFGGRVIAPAMAELLLLKWLETEFEAGRHTDRVQMMDEAPSKSSEFTCG